MSMSSLSSSSLSIPPNDCSSINTRRHRKRPRPRNIVDLHWRSSFRSPSSLCVWILWFVSTKSTTTVWGVMGNNHHNLNNNNSPPHHHSKESTSTSAMTTTASSGQPSQSQTRLDQPTYASFSEQQDNNSPTTKYKKRRQQQQSPPQNVIQLMETEYYDGQHWKPPLPTHTTKKLSSPPTTPPLTPWTTLDGQPSVHPTQLKPPPHTKFVDNWKIVTGDRRDNMGWEYFWNTQSGVRRRTWLRTIQPLHDEFQEISTKHQTKQHHKKKKKITKTKTRLSFRQRRRIAKLEKLATPRTPPQPKSSISILQSIQDDWNFKGFGMTLFKSLLDPQSCGIALRIPLSPNFDWCDRHPAFPAVSLSWGIYYPFMTGIFLSSSINVQWLQYVFEVVMQRIQCLCKLVYMVVWTTLTFPLFWIMPTTYRKYQHDQWKFIRKPPRVPSPQYSLEILERIGMSYSWRYSLVRGYEFRTGYWHWWAPTIVYLHSLWEVARNTVVTTMVTSLPNQKKKKKNTPQDSGSSTEDSTTRSSSTTAGDATTTITTSSSSSHKLIHWMRQKFGSLGLSSSIPLPDPPYFASSACLSLSGFYFQRLRPQRSRRSPPSSRTLETTTGSTPHTEKEQVVSVLSSSTVDKEDRISPSSSTATTTTTVSSSIKEEKKRIAKEEGEINRALQDSKRTKTLLKKKTKTEILHPKDDDDNDHDKHPSDAIPTTTSLLSSSSSEEVAKEHKQSSTSNNNNNNSKAAGTVAG